MAHTVPMPKGAVSPFPLKASQAAELQDARHELAEQSAANFKAAAHDSRSGSRLILSIAVGAVAAASALLYFNRDR